MRWTQEQRKAGEVSMVALWDCNPDHWSHAALELACQRNELLEALKGIAAALDPDSESSYRADDSEGAMDGCHSMALAAIAKAEAA